MRPANRGANGKNSSKWIRPEKRLAIYHRDGFRCVYCLRTAAFDEILLSLDHVVRRCDGGSNEASNLVTSCLRCNSSRWKSAPPTEEVQARIQAAIAKLVDIEAGRSILRARGTFGALGRSFFT